MSVYHKIVDTVRAKGAQAYYEGLGLDSCPYKTIGKQGRKFQRIWREGYYAAQENQRAIVLVIGVNNEH